MAIGQHETRMIALLGRALMQTAAELEAAEPSDGGSPAASLDAMLAEETAVATLQAARNVVSRILDNLDSDADLPCECFPSPSP